jgi:hypothetical protein
MMRREEILKRE